MENSTESFKRFRYIQLTNVFWAFTTGHFVLGAGEKEPYKKIPNLTDLMLYTVNKHIIQIYIKWW